MRSLWREHDRTRSLFSSGAQRQLTHIAEATNLLKWESTGSAEYPATGGSGQWWINQSKVLSLPELLWWGHQSLTMYELYEMWLRYPIFATKKKHSESQAEQAVMTRNSKQLRHNEEGIWGLNKPRRESPGPPRGRQRRG